ncbi:MAG: hypothetical protein K6V73_04535 [Firmicutes bacterium]|nr:hypothetical protein [Bacillota bacterium]
MAEGVGREEACRVLNTTPRVLRRLWAAYGPLLGGERLPRSLDGRQLRLLARALALEGAGRAREEVAAALLADGEEASSRLAEDLRDRLDGIAAAIQRTEARRLAEHDRLLTALIRTQQELGHLRYELAAATPRRERRRPLWRFWERRPGA